MTLISVNRIFAEHADFRMFMMELCHELVRVVGRHAKLGLWQGFSAEKLY